MYRSLPIAVVLAAFVLLAGCIAPLQTDSHGTPAQQVDEPTESTIQTTGVGRVTAPPDVALVSVVVQDRADSADAARDRVAADADSLLSALTDAGVPADAVTTASFSIRAQYDHRKEAPELVGFHAVHAFRIETTPERAGDVVDISVDAAGATVRGVRFTLSDETRAALRTEAVAAAVASARLDADAAAGAAGLAVSGVESIRVDGAGGYWPVAEQTRGDAATTFRPGPVTVTATVSVTYALE